MTRQSLDRARTTWHITFGTYGTRLHGGLRPTVERAHNLPGEPFIDRNPFRLVAEQKRMLGPAVVLTFVQRALIESELPLLCARGGWTCRISAAPADGDHVHVLCDVDSSVHGKRVRQWLKRWLSEMMDKRWGRPPGGSWWAEGGSTKVVRDEAYLQNVLMYIERQRTTPHIAS